ncbi:MAG TPA: HlyD family secretion protein [Steroidobacteraceae bacterium]|jgi:membrane fusion protein, multidrug efflux system|nr:HlyD family secretion protein [Steroidobacteraceae bacterium]
MPPAAEEDDAKDGKAEKSRSKKPLIILGIVVIAAAVIAFFVWFAHRNQVSTDDAYTDGNVISIAPKVSGYVVDLLIDDNSRVSKGDVLVRIESQDFRTAQDSALGQLALARAQLKSAETALRIAHVQYPAQLASAQAQQQAAAAMLAQAEASYARQHQVDRRATTQESIDTSTSQQLSSNANLKSAKAQVAVAALVPEQIQQAINAVAERTAALRQAEAQLEQANLNLSYTEIRAPADGFVTMRNVQRGSYLTAGQTMFLIVTADVWITANFKESQIGRMRPGDAVDVEVDAYSGFKLHGHVQSIQYGSGSRFSAFPAENATGNFVKIVQRVPVKIIIDKGLDPDRPLPLGLSVSPVVHFP